MLTVTLYDDQCSGKEQVGLGRVEEPAQELVVVGFESGVGRPHWKGAVTDDHVHGLKFGTSRELRTMGGQQDLNLLMSFSLVGIWLGGAGREHLHEQRLVLGV